MQKTKASRQDGRKGNTFTRSIRFSSRTPSNTHECLDVYAQRDAIAEGSFAKLETGLCEKCASLTFNGAPVFFCRMKDMPTANRRKALGIYEQYVSLHLRNEEGQNILENGMSAYKSVSGTPLPVENRLFRAGVTYFLERDPFLVLNTKLAFRFFVYSPLATETIASVAAVTKRIVACIDAVIPVVALGHIVLAYLCESDGLAYRALSLTKHRS